MKFNRSGRNKFSEQREFILKGKCGVISLEMLTLLRSVNNKVNPIWTGGGAKGPLRVFAKYLKNGLADLHETFKTII